MIGVPGSGKGTQAKLIAHKYNYLHLSTGDLLRNLAEKKNLNKKEGEAVSLMKTGELVPDKIIFSLVFGAILKTIKEKDGVVLDGAIRNVEQAKGFDIFFKDNNLQNEILALEIKISDTESLKRLSMRRVCTKCSEIIPWLDSTKEMQSCPKCGGELKSRQDDNLETIKERIKKQGNDAIRGIVKYYSKKKTLVIINGQQDIQDVEKDVNEKLMNYANQVR